MISYYQDSWESEEWADEEAQLRADLAVERARATKAQAELKALQASQPKDLTEQLAALLGRPVAEVKAEVAQIRAQGSTAPNPDRLSELLAKLDPNDLEGVNRAYDQAGFVREDILGQTWKGGRLQRAGQPQGAPEEIYAFLDTATSLEDYEAKLRQVGLLLEGGAV